MQSILILALTLMGLMGNPNMGGPERLALTSRGGLQHVTQPYLDGSAEHGKNLRPGNEPSNQAGGAEHGKKPRPDNYPANK